MASKIKPIPPGYHSVTPYLITKEADKAIEFYKNAFKATATLCMKDPSGKICHAEIKIGNSPIMLADEFPEMDVRSPQSLGGSPVTLHLYVEDVDNFVKHAVNAGATILKPVKDEFYGDRAGTLVDPFGHIWHIATHKEDVSPEEMHERLEQYMKQKTHN
ncbi:MAG: glyoxalase [Gammaproteobacteria bacterium RIFCSPHIGHO2_12_FULL_42_13]|nr:MAG: glyoxalase [Gammaproteobacteria bacterium RIFCSPHIGHO2_12_FULL_42_13]